MSGGTFKGWLAAIGLFWLTAIIGGMLATPHPVATANHVPAVSAPTQQAKKRENQLIGCQVLLTAVAANLRDLNAECNDRLLTWDDPVRCVLVGAALRNRNFGQPELNPLPPNTRVLLVKACMMLVHGVDENLANDLAKDTSR
jgi:hypothetical protein